MSASGALNPDQTGPMQLPMFMRATDYVDSLTGTLDRSHLSVEEVMGQKLEQAKAPIEAGTHGSGVYDSVESGGVLNAVQMVHGMNNSLLAGQGHHRAAAGEDIGRETGRDMWLPVVHTDAREHSANPVDIYSDMGDKKRAIADYREWSTGTSAIGQDIGWMQDREDAANAHTAMFNRQRISDFLLGSASPDVTPGRESDDWTVM